MFFDLSTKVLDDVFADTWKSSARASMTSSFMGDGWAVRSFKKLGSVSDKMRVKIGAFGADKVCMLARPQTEGERSGWASEICNKREVGSLEDVTK